MLGWWKHAFRSDHLAWSVLAISSDSWFYILLHFQLVLWRFCLVQDSENVGLSHRILWFPNHQLKICFTGNRKATGWCSCNRCGDRSTYRIRGMNFWRSGYVSLVHCQIFLWQGVNSNGKSMDMSIFLCYTNFIFCFYALFWSKFVFLRPSQKRSSIRDVELVWFGCCLRYASSDSLEPSRINTVIKTYWILCRELYFCCTELQVDCADPAS